MHPFSTPWKLQKTYSFLMFLEVRERVHWKKMGWINLMLLLRRLKDMFIFKASHNNTIFLLILVKTLVLVPWQWNTGAKDRRFYLQCDISLKINNHPPGEEVT